MPLMIAVDADDFISHKVAQQGRDDGCAARDASLEQHLKRRASVRA